MRGVGVRRGTPWLLEDVDWDVRTGDRWVVLGPNGAGKTTLIQVSATTLFPTTGELWVLEEPMGATDAAELRPRIGLASPHSAALIPPSEKVANAVVTASWAVSGRWREHYEDLDHERAAWLLEQLGIAHLADRTFGTLSEGERKRVQIARALMPNPELLLLDEPAAGLDLGAREDLVQRLDRLSADPAAPTSVIVTHHVEEVPVGTTHALLLREGRVVAAGPAGEVLQEGALSHAFGIGLSVNYENGRWAARAR
jgi:iron complex transport system ATP-binding protein